MLLLRQIAKDLLYALSHRHNIWTAFGEPFVGSGGDKPIASIQRHVNQTFKNLSEICKDC